MIDQLREMEGRILIAGEQLRHVMKIMREIKEEGDEKLLVIDIEENQPLYMEKNMEKGRMMKEKV